MEKVLIIFCMFAASSAIFFPLINLPNQRQSMMNVCIYSVNPTRYQPKCFLCPSTVFPNVLRACVNAAAIPSNISYTQASCIEQNCAIRRGKRSVDLQQPDNLLEEVETREPFDQSISDIHPENGEPERTSSSAVHQESTYPTVGTQEFTASDYGDYDEGSDYSEMDE